ncbi:hypothetical protein ACP70R_033162 [Stipagrostis hirtigluma subsp. patula]
MVPAPPPQAIHAGLGGVKPCTVVALAVANRVLYKLALVPLKAYPFFLAQLTTFGQGKRYVAVYFSILYARHRAGVVTRDMLALPKRRFVAIGLLEALGVASGMSARAMLPGPAIPILSQCQVNLASTDDSFEAVFIDGAKRLKGKRPDIFVVSIRLDLDFRRNCG